LPPPDLLLLDIRLNPYFPAHQSFTMPKSKRNRLITLSKVQKQPSREKNERLYTAIREELENHTYAFIFSVDNMRNTFLKDIRAQWEDSRCEPSFDTCAC